MAAEGGRMHIPAKANFSHAISSFNCVLFSKLPNADITAFNTTSSSSSSESNSNLAIILTPQSIAQNILQDIFLFHKFPVPHLLLHIDNAMAHSLSL